MPSHDALELLAQAKDTIMRAAGDDTLVAQTADYWLTDVAKFIEEERREHESTLALVMDEDRDFEEYLI